MSSCVVQIVCVITNQGSSNPNYLDFKDVCQVLVWANMSYTSQKAAGYRWQGKESTSGSVNIHSLSLSLSLSFLFPSFFISLYILLSTYILGAVAICRHFVSNKRCSFGRGGVGACSFEKKSAFLDRAQGRASS